MLVGVTDSDSCVTLKSELTIFRFCHVCFCVWEEVEEMCTNVNLCFFSKIF